MEDTYMNYILPKIAIDHLNKMIDRNPDLLLEVADFPDYEMEPKLNGRIFEKSSGHEIHILESTAQRFNKTKGRVILYKDGKRIFNSYNQLMKRTLIKMKPSFHNIDAERTRQNFDGYSVIPLYPDYSMNDQGWIIRNSTGKRVKPIVPKDRPTYQYVKLYKNGSRYRVSLEKLKKIWRQKDDILD